MSLLKIYQGLRNHILLTRRKKEHRSKVRSFPIEYVLTKEQEAQIQAFYAPYGKKVDTWFHNYYYQATGEFRPDYLPDDFYFCFVDPYYNNWMEARHLDNKCYYRLLFPNVRQPETVASREGGMWFDAERRSLTMEALTELLAKEPEIVVKNALISSGGKGVFFTKGTDLEPLQQIPKHTDIVIQRPLVQHADLAKVNPSSVNTIRMLSMLTDGEVKIHSSILRIGVGGARVDNVGIGGITCGVTEDGKLKKYAYTILGKRLESHPDTGLVFEGYSLPFYEKCVQTVKNLHVQLPHFRIISWDISVDESGEPALIEANLCYGCIDLHQMSNGTVFGEDTRKILDEAFKNKKK